MALRQQGDVVTGHYVGKEWAGLIKNGRLSGRVLKGEWLNTKGNGRQGTFTVTLSPDGGSFTGTYQCTNAPGEGPGAWTGVHKGPLQQGDGFLRKEAAPALDLSGRWNGGDWGNVDLVKTESGDYTGTYSQTNGVDTGRLSLRCLSGTSYEGTWWEGAYRSGSLSIKVAEDGRSAGGTWSADNRCSHNPGNPQNAALEWRR